MQPTPCLLNTPSIFFVKSLELLSSGGDEHPFWMRFRSYVDAMFSRSGKRQTERMNYMMTLALTGGTNQNVVLITDEDHCGYAALHFSHIASQAGEQDSDWEPLYVSHSDFEHLRSKVLRCWVIRSKAIALLRKSRHKEALNVLLHNFSDAEELVKEDPTSYGKTLNLLGCCCLLEGDKVRARKYYTDALHSLEGGERNQTMVRNILECLTNLGSPALLDASKPDVSRGYLQQALTLAEEVYGEDHEDVIKILCIMANTEYALGNFTKVRKLCQRIPSNCAAISEDQMKIVQAAEDLCTPGPAIASRGGKKKKKRTRQAALKESNTPTALEKKKRKEDSAEAAIEYSHDHESKQCIPESSIGESRSEDNFSSGTEKASKPAGFEKEEEKADVAESVIEGSLEEENQHQDLENERNFPQRIEEPDKPAGLEKDEEKADVAESDFEDSQEEEIQHQDLESESSFPQGIEESDKPACLEKEEKKEYPAEAIIEEPSWHDDESKQCGREPTIGGNHSEGSCPPGTKKANRPAGLEKEAKKEDVAEGITEPVVEDPRKEESKQQESEDSTSEGLEDVPGPEDPIVLDLQCLTEAVALLAFKRTANELDKSTKRLAETLLGPRWVTDKKKRMELPSFLIEAIGKTPSKSAETSFGTQSLLSFLGWLSKQSPTWQFAEDKKVQEAGKVCQSIGEDVKKITLLDLWMNLCHTPPPQSIMLELNAYKTTLTKLGCEDAARVVEELSGHIPKVVKEAQPFKGATKEFEITVMASIVEVAVVLRVLQHVNQYIYEFYRDSRSSKSEVYGGAEEGQTAFLLKNLDLIQKRVGFPEFSRQTLDSLKCLPKYLIELLHKSGRPESKDIFNFWQGFLDVKKLFGWQPTNSEQEQRDLYGLLRRFFPKSARRAEYNDPVNVLIPRQLESVYPREKHRWLAPNEEKFVGRTKELSQICGLLDKQAGKVLVTGPSGIGKSLLVRQAAFRLRTAWPIQFILDMSTPFSRSESQAEVVSYYKGKMKEDDRWAERAIAEVYKSTIQDGHDRALIVLENLQLDCFNAFENFAAPQRNNVSIIFVSSRVEECQEVALNSKDQQEKIDLVIELTPFSSEESIESFAAVNRSGKLKLVPGVEDAFQFTNNHPIAVRVAVKLLQNAPKNILQNLESFASDLSQQDLEGSEVGSPFATGFGCESPLALRTGVLFALKVMGNQPELLDLACNTSLLAWPTVPLALLPSLFAADITEFENTLDNMFELEKLGLVVHEHTNNEIGQRPCFRMHASISQVVQAKMLTLPADKCYLHFARCLELIRDHLNGKEEASRNNLGSIARSAVQLERSGLLEQFLARETCTTLIRKRLLSLQANLLHNLGRVFGSPSECSSVVSTERACDFFTKSLMISSHLHEKEAFWNVGRDYLTILTKNHPPSTLLIARLHQLLIIFESGFGKWKLIDDEKLSIVALKLIENAIRLDDYSWGTIYVSAAEDLTQDTVGRLRLIYEKVFLCVKQKMYSKAKQACWKNFQENETAYSKVSVAKGLTYFSLAEIWIDVWDREEARKCLVEAVPLLAPFKGHSGCDDIKDTLFQCYLHLGSVPWLDKRNPDVSRDYLKQALALTNPNSLISREKYFLTLSMMAQLEEALGNNAKAMEIRRRISPEFAGLDLVETKVGQPLPDSPDKLTTFSTSTSKKRKKKKTKKKKAATEEEKKENELSQ